MKSKKLLSLILIGGMILFNSLSVFADTTSGEVVETATIGIGDLPTQEAIVSYVSAEHFAVIIPKKINLDGTQTNPETTFNISCTGDVAGTSYIKVTADESFTLKQKGKEDVVADVYNKGFSTEPYFSTTFSSSQIASGKTVEGAVSVPDENGNKLSAGAWSGSFNFYIKWFGLVDEEETESGNDEIETYGLYQGENFTPWSELENEGKVVINDGYLETINIVDLSGRFVLPDTITNIDMRFNANKTLENIDLSKTKITTLTQNAFSGCSNLETVILPDTLTKFEYIIFSNCPKLTNINYSGTVEQWNNINKNEFWKDSSSIKTITCEDDVITL